MARTIDGLTNTDPIDGTNPYGKVRDETSPGSNDGTPVNEAMINDVLIFFQRLLSEAGISANELPENTVNGFQFYTALQILAVGNAGNTGLFTSLKTKVIEIGDWNMDANDQITLTNVTIPYASVRAINAIIRNDGDTLRLSLNDQAAQGGIGLTTTDTGYISWALGSGGSSFTNITLGRVLSGYFDNASYDSTSYNRGFLVINYEE